MNITKSLIPIKQTPQERQEESEIWHKLVVKIVIWKEGSAQNLLNTTTKLALSEWKTYYERIIKININQNKEKVLSDLEYTLQKIKLHGGFKK